MATHGIGNTALVKASQLQVLSARYFEGGSAVDIDNGRVVILKGMVSGERELMVASTPSATPTDRLYFVRTPEVTYKLDETGLDQFYNLAGNELRVYPMAKDDVFETTYSNLDTSVTPAVGKYLVMNAATNKLVVSNTAVGAFVGEIVELITLGFNKATAVAFRVLANG